VYLFAISLINLSIEQHLNYYSSLQSKDQSI